MSANQCTRPGQVIPLAEGESLAKGLPVVSWPAPPRGASPDASEVDPLRPETWRPLVKSFNHHESPPAGAVVLAHPPQGPGPAPATLAARGLRHLGRLLARPEAAA